MKNNDKNIFLIGLAIQFFLLIMPQLPTMFRAWQVVCFNLGFFVYNSVMTFLLLKIFMNCKMRFIAQAAVAVAVCIVFFFALTFICKLIFGSISYDKETILLYVSTLCISALIGHLQTTLSKKRQKEQEVENLKKENLKSRYAALNNQVHPHFFFNSLNSMAALIRTDRKEESLRFCNEMSRIFRYIMQKDTQTLTTLAEETNFINSYLYMLAIRYGDALECNVDIPEDALTLRLPSLSLLPLVENIAKHNVIDGRHKMGITIKYEKGTQSVTVMNPIYKKTAPVASDGIGLTNLNERYRLITGKPIKIQQTEEYFLVNLPLVE